MGIFSRIVDRAKQIINPSKPSTPSAPAPSSPTPVNFGAPTSSSPSGTYITKQGGVSYQAPSGSVGAAVTNINKAAARSGGGSSGGGSVSQPQPVSAQQSVSIQNTPVSKTPPAASISAYSALNNPMQTRMNQLYSDNMVTETGRTATAREMQQAGYHGYATGNELASTPSGRGTIIRKEEVSVGNLAIREYNNAQAMANLIAENAAKKVHDEKQKFVDATFNNLQEGVNAGTISVEDANKNLKNVLEKTNSELQTEVKSKLESSTQYNKAVDKVAEVQAKWDIKKTFTGTDYAGKLQQTKGDKRKEITKDILEQVVLPVISVEAAIPYYAIKAAQAGKNAPLVYQGQDLEADIKSGKMKEYVEIATPEEKKYAFLGAGAAVAGAFTLEFPKFEVVNQGKINAAEMKRVYQASLKRLGLDKNAAFEKLGTTKQIEIKDLLSKALPQEYQSFIKESNIGLAKRFNIKTGENDLRYILSSSVRTGEEAGKDYTMTFGLSKTGRLKAPRLAVTDFEKQMTNIFREAKPSELADIRYAEVKGQNPLEVFETNRLKLEKVLKIKGAATSDEFIAEDKIIKIINKKGIAREIGKGIEGKGTTLSYEEMYNLPKTPMVSKAIKNGKVFASQSREMQILNEKVLTEDFDAGMQRILGRQRKGLTYEQGITKEFTQEPILNIKVLKESKPFRYDEVKDILKARELPRANNVHAMNNAVKKALESPGRSYPSYVGEIHAPAGTLGTKDIFNQLSQKEINRILYSPEIGFQEQQLTRVPKQVFEEVTKRNKMISSPLMNAPGMMFGKGKNKVSADFMSSLQETPVVSTRQIERQLQKLDSGNVLVTKQSSGLGIASALAIEQQLAQAQKLVEKQMQQPRLQQPKMQQPRLREKDIFKTGFDIPGFALPFGKNLEGHGNIDKMFQAKKPGRREPQYTADIAAAAFQETPMKVTQKTMNKLNKAVFSGLETRPLLQLVSEKKSKKKGRRIDLW